MRHRYRASKPKELRPQAQLELSDRQGREIIERLRPNMLVIHEAIRIEGKSELRRPVSSLAWSGLAAGLSIGFSLGIWRLTHERTKRCINLCFTNCPLLNFNFFH